MYNRRFDFVEIFEGVYHLNQYTSGLPFRYRFVLFQIEVEVVSVAVLENSTKGIGVDFEHVIESDHSGVV